MKLQIKLALVVLLVLAFADQARAVPIADDGAFQTPAGTTVNGNLSDFVSDFTNPDFAAISPPTHGTFVLQIQTGAFSYTPAPGYLGPDLVQYRAFEAVNPTIFDIGLISINVCPAGTCTPGRVFVTPEPASAFLLLLGFGGLAARLATRQHKAT
jgi:hypothetical protein